MIGSQNLFFPFRRVGYSRIECAVGTAGFAFIFLLTCFGLAIFDDVGTFTFGTGIYNYLRYHDSMILSVNDLPVPHFVGCSRGFITAYQRRDIEIVAANYWPDAVKSA